MAITETAGTKNRPGRKGYYTLKFTGSDIRKARGLLDKQAKESAAKIAAEKATWKVPVRNIVGERKLVSEEKAQRILTMQKAWYRKGPVATRPTFTMNAYIKNGRVVHPGDPDY